MVKRNTVYQLINILSNTAKSISLKIKLKILERYYINKYSQKKAVLATGTNAQTIIKINKYIIKSKIVISKEIIQKIFALHKNKDKIIFQYNQKIDGRKIEDLDNIPIDQKTDYVSKVFKKKGFIVNKFFFFKGYDEPIFFRVLKGKYKKYLLKKSWRSFKKYNKEVNIQALVNPNLYINDVMKEKNYSIKQNYIFSELKKPIIFSMNYGIYKDILMSQRFVNILRSEVDSSNFYDPDIAVRKLFLKRKRKIKDYFSFKNKIMSKLDIPNYPTEGKFKDFLFYSKINKTIGRNDGFEFKNLFEKERFIKSLIPKYSLKTKITKDSKGSDTIKIICDQDHIWTVKIQNVIHGSKCLHCAAENKNQIGGESFETYLNNPKIAKKISNTYIVKIKGEKKFHYKIGIANNILKRGGGKYIKIFYKFNSLRANCWCLEMYLKKLTYKFRSGHHDKKIDGWTEFRNINKIDIKKLINVSNSINKKIISIGWKRFYNKYLKKGKKLDHRINDFVTK